MPVSVLVLEAVRPEGEHTRKENKDANNRAKNEHVVQCMTWQLKLTEMQRKFKLRLDAWGRLFLYRAFCVFIFYVATCHKLANQTRHMGHWRPQTWQAGYLYMVR